VSDPRDNVQQEFLAEAQELVEALSRDLLLLDEAFHRGDRIEPTLINEIFRSVHTLKGIAGMFGYQHVGAVAHALEDLLDDLRLGRTSVGQQLLDVVVPAAHVDVARGVLRKASRPAPGVELEQILARIVEDLDELGESGVGGEHGQPSA